MGPRVLVLIQRVALLAALGVSSALLVDYWRPVPAFCGLGSGCAQVRASSFSHPAGIPLPLLGVLGFFALAAATLASSGTMRRAALWLTVAAGASGALLFSIQWLVLHVFCHLCLGVDFFAVAAAIAAVLLLRLSSHSKEITTDTAPDSPWPWLAALAVVVALPVIWGKIEPAPPIPRAIGMTWAKDKINVVEFADFECPFCRELHPILREVLSKYGTEVHFVRINMPLSQHSHARDAARAYVCADLQGKGPAMADALFGAAEELTPAANRALAGSIGVALTTFDECVVDSKTDAHIDEQIDLVRSTDFKGLPTVWIDDQRLVGLQPAAVFEDAFAHAAAKLKNEGTNR